jgi:hypothetical protein
MHDMVWFGHIVNDLKKKEMFAQKHTLINLAGT